MTSFVRQLEIWTTYQDYIWFLAVLAWGAVIGAEVRNRNSVGESCLLPAFRIPLLLFAGCAIFGAALELALLVQDLWIPYVGYDVAMGAAQSLGIAVLAFPVLHAVSSPQLKAAVLAALGLALACARVTWPVEGGFALELFAAVVGTLYIRAVRTDRLIAGLDSFERGALQVAFGLLALWPALSTHGPIAFLTHQPRITKDYSHLALLAAAIIGLAGTLVGLSFWRRRLRLTIVESELGPGRKRDFKRGLAVLAVWLAVGLALAIWSGRVARASFEASLVQRAVSASAMLDRTELRDAFGPALQIEGKKIVPYVYGDYERAKVSHRASPVFNQIGEQLRRIRLANPDLLFAYVEVIRDGRLLIPISDRDRRQGLTELDVQRKVTAGDMAQLDAANAFVEGPKRTYFGTGFFVRAPLQPSRAEKPLGWLVFMVPATHWLASFTEVRLQAMALAGAGVVLWWVAIAYRLQRDQKLAAGRKAALAVESDRLKTTFLAKVSHELRTPIQSVLGYGELLEQAPLEPAQHRWLAALRTHGEDMLRMVNDLLDLGALQVGAFHLRPTTVNLPALVADCAGVTQVNAEAKNLRFAAEISRDLPPWVEADPVRLRQVLLNLLGNAVKFTSTGVVTLAVRRLAGGVADRAEIEFEISDTGPGIPRAARGRLFQPFSRLDAAGQTEGTGLGLSLVAGLCSAMAGSVHHADRSPAGSVFTVRLSLRLQTAPYVKTPDTATADHRGIRIVVAEDNALVREYLTEILRQGGAEVFAVSDGAAAIAACQEHSPHAVLLDIGLPTMDGFAVAQAIRHERGGDKIRIVGVSARARPEDESEARAAGMDSFLVKPIRRAQLDAALGGVLAASRPEVASTAVGWHQLHARLRSQFNRETPGVVEELRQAWRAGNWERVRTRAHYLKNSADVLGAKDLQRACQMLSDLAVEKDRYRAARLVAAVERAARRAYSDRFAQN